MNQMQALSNEQIARVAPSVFATEPWQGVSDRYAFIPTIQVVDRLRDEGFFPVRAQQSRSRIPGKGDFTKHMLRFRRESDMAIPKVVDGNTHYFFKVPPVVPELVLVNAHDRSSAYALDAGLFRQLCSNGLMVSAGDLAGIHVRHSGNVVDDVLEGSFKIIDEMPQVMEHVEHMRAIQLALPQQIAFATAAAEVRWGHDDKGAALAPVQPEQLLRPRRREDDAADLWATFNRVQENMIKGGLRGRGTTGKRTTTRAVGSVTEDVRLNKALWMLAEKMAQLAA